MRYLSFRIANYRAIDGDILIRLPNRRPLPIIGVNEGGKTTILEAICAFDKYADKANEGRHLKNTSNMYKTTDRVVPTVAATLSCTKAEIGDFLAFIEEAAEITEDDKSQVAVWKKHIRKSWLGEITLERNLASLKYSLIQPSKLSESGLADRFCDHVMAHTPWIVYFDDFRDQMPDLIEIEEKQINSSWLAILERLFQKTNPEYSTIKLESLNETDRDNILGEVTSKVNDTIAREWQRFSIEGTSRLKLVLKYQSKVEKSLPSIQIRVAENVGPLRYFKVSDRSKGFRWYFNFVMKLEFNPKVRDASDHETIYLLDEPGSYLHASAQSSLCKKLARLSREGTVIYCTHSHYLLDPDVIPFSSVIVAQKRRAHVHAIPLPQYKSKNLRTNMALQPLWDALDIRPFMPDISTRRVCVVEGIYDYYALKMFSNVEGTVYFPAGSAVSVRRFVSIMLGWGVKFVALWDCDEEGLKEHGRAVVEFGQGEVRHLTTLREVSGRTNSKSVILQDLFDGQDLRLARSLLSLGTDSSFESTVLSLFYSPEREKILKKLDGSTAKNVRSVARALEERF